MQHRPYYSRFASIGFILFGLAQVPAANAADVPMPFEKVWSKALQTLALDGMSITASDKQSGVVQFAGTFGEPSELFECPRASGALVKRVFSGTLVMKANADGTTFVMIQSAGNEMRYRNHHLLMFKTGTVDFENPCKSTGRLESGFIQRLTTT